MLRESLHPTPSAAFTAYWAGLGYAQLLGGTLGVNHRLVAGV